MSAVGAADVGVRDALAPLQNVINDEGDIVVPVDPRYLGLWLTGLLGNPDTTNNGDDSFDHEFASGGDDLPSYTVEVDMPKVPAFFRHAGVKLNSIALEFTRSGPAAATITAIAQGETRFGTSRKASLECSTTASFPVSTEGTSADADRDPHARARTLNPGSGCRRRR